MLDPLRALMLLSTGILMAVAGYHLGVHLLIARRDKSHLFVALNATSVGLHGALVDPQVFAWLTGLGLPAWCWQKVEHVAVFSSMYFGIGTMQRLYPEEVRGPIIQVANGVSIAFAAVALLAPFDVYARLRPPFQIIGLLSMLVVAYQLVQARRAQRANATFVLVALWVYIAGSLHDVLLVRGLLSSPLRLRTVSFLVFVGSQAWSLAERYGASVARTEQLTQALRGSNETLLATNRSIMRFVPEEFFALLGRRSIVDIERGDHRALELSVLFCDIRAFTPLIESLPTGSAFRFINDYLSAMEAPIHRHGGFINQYLGDCVMALFPGRPDDAVGAAIEMMRALEDFNRTHLELPHAIRAGIGVHTGHLMLGAIGGQRRVDTGVVGEAVNLASRLEGLTKDYGASLIISDATLKKLERPERLSLRELDTVMPRGTSKALRIFDVLDALDETTRAARLRTRSAYAAGLRALHDGELGRARQHFVNVLSHDPNDRAARIQLDKSERPFSAPSRSA